MGQPYTHGTWTVTPGREEEFVAAGPKMTEWTGRDVPGSIWVKLVHDTNAPRRFIRFGAWESLDAIEAWRAHAGFQQRFQRLRELLGTLELVAQLA